MWKLNQASNIRDAATHIRASLLAAATLRCTQEADGKPQQDRLERRNLPHPARCVLCDQEPEDIQHLLATCVFSREFWFRVLSSGGWHFCTPSQSEHSFADWWRKSVKKVQKDKRKGFNSLVVLVAWMIWKHRNKCVFEGDSPGMASLYQAFKDELLLWCLAGARKLRSLSTGQDFGVG